MSERAADHVWLERYPGCLPKQDFLSLSLYLMPVCIERSTINAPLIEYPCWAAERRLIKCSQHVAPSAESFCENRVWLQYEILDLPSESQCHSDLAHTIITRGNRFSWPPPLFCGIMASTKGDIGAIGGWEMRFKWVWIARQEQACGSCSWEIGFLPGRLWRHLLKCLVERGGWGHFNITYPFLVSPWVGASHDVSRILNDFGHNPALARKASLSLRPSSIYTRSVQGL